MHTTVDTVLAPPASHRFAQRWLAALACFVAGAATLGARWISDDIVRFAWVALLCALFFVSALLLRRAANAAWAVPFAFGIFAVVQLLNNSLPAFVAEQILYAPSTPGNPLAGTVSASVLIQLLETAIAVVPVVWLTLASGQSLDSIYMRASTPRRWLIAAVVFFVLVCVFVATRGASRILPTNAPVSLSLAPALLLMVFANGLQEEVLFRGLFLDKYAALFGAGLANVVQAMVFTFAHLGITYSSSAALFLVLAVFPLGLLAGYLMRATNSILVPLIVHATLDVPIYLVFLSSVS